MVNRVATEIVSRQEKYGLVLSLHFKIIWFYVLSRQRTNLVQCRVLYSAPERPLCFFAGTIIHCVSSQFGGQKTTFSWLTTYLPIVVTTVVVNQKEW